MPELYDSPSEAAAHEEAIDALVAEMNLPPNAVRTVYEQEYVRLRHEARVKEFLLLFTFRRAREALRHTA
jgi:hypothetical protein